LAWSAIDAEPYCEEPVHHDRKRVHKLVNIIAGVPVALAVGMAIFTMQHQTAAPSSAPSTPTVCLDGRFFSGRVLVSRFPTASIQ